MSLLPSAVPVVSTELERRRDPGQPLTSVARWPRSTEVREHLIAPRAASRQSRHMFLNAAWVCSHLEHIFCTHAGTTQRVVARKRWDTRAGSGLFVFAFKGRTTWNPNTCLQHEQIRPHPNPVSQHRVYLHLHASRLEWLMWGSFNRNVEAGFLVWCILITTYVDFNTILSSSRKLFKLTTIRKQGIWKRVSFTKCLVLQPNLI